MKIAKWRMLPAMVLAVALLVFSAGPVMAQDVPVTSFFSGDVAIDDAPAPDGSGVAAFVGDETEPRETTTTTGGTYGIMLLGSDSDVGQAVSFKVQEVGTDEWLDATTEPEAPTYARYDPQVVNLFAFTDVTITFTITATAGEGGTIDPLGVTEVNYGDSQAFTITADLGYEIADVLVDGVSVGAVESYTFENVTADGTIHATFALQTFTITATAGDGGSILPSGDVVVNYGDGDVFTITADTGYEVEDVLIDGESIGVATQYNFEDVTADHTIHATFTPIILTINATAEAGGSIDPLGVTEVSYGADQAFTITADTGYEIADVLVGGVSVGAVESYTFENVTANHNIHATFALAGPVSFTTTLLEGWNLLSTPILLDADSDTLGQIFGTDVGNIEVAYSWDAQNEQWVLLTNDYELLPLYGIYLKVSSGSSATAEFFPSLEISGPPSRVLEPGLNLIGTAPALEAGVFSAMPLNLALISIEEAPGGLRGYTIVISPGLNQTAWSYALGGEVEDLVPFNGYWVVMENADTLFGFSTTP